MNIRQLVPETRLFPVELRLIVLVAACCLSLAIPNDVDKLSAQQIPFGTAGPVSQAPVPQLQVPQSQLPQLIAPLVPPGQPTQVPLTQVPLTQPPNLPPQAIPMQAAPPQQRDSVQLNSVFGSFIPGSPSPRNQSSATSVKTLEPPVGGPAANGRAIGSALIADDISSIRQQLGSGLSEQLSEMTKHWRTEGQGNPAWDELVKSGFKDEITRLANDRANEEAAYVARGFAAVKPAPSPADQLRSAARELDQMASQFEATGLYEEADQVRAQAQKFWIKSRQF